MPTNLTNYALRESDLPLLSQVQEKLLAQQVTIPDWREIDPSVQRRFQAQVRQVLMRQVNPVDLEDTTQRLSDALSGIGLLQPFL